MISKKDKINITEAGKEIIFDIVINSKILKEKLSFKDHLNLCKEVLTLEYNDVIKLLTEDVTAFENKFRPYLRYGYAELAAIGTALSATRATPAPTVAMMTLYHYRKLTDTCSRPCMDRFKDGAARKICRYTCQARAASVVTRNIRNEVSRCRGFKRPNICESKLKNQFEKWTNKTKALVEKVQSSKTGLADTERKRAETERQNKATRLAANLNLKGSDVLKIIIDNKQIREAFSFRDHLLFYHTFKSIGNK